MKRNKSDDMSTKIITTTLRACADRYVGHDRAVFLQAADMLEEAEKVSKHMDDLHDAAMALSLIHEPGQEEAP